MENAEAFRKRFQKYIGQAYKAHSPPPHTDLMVSGFFNSPEVVDYTARLPIDPSTQFLTNKIREEVARVNNPRILVVGDGVGKLARNISKTIHRSQVTEIDLSIPMLSKARQLAREQRLRSFDVAKGDATRLPFRTKSFDYIASYGLSRYLSPMQASHFAIESVRVSRHGFIIADGNFPDTLELLRRELFQGYRIQTEKMEMFRMFLFYQLFRLYNYNPEFRQQVDPYIGHRSSLIDVLTKIAGSGTGNLYHLTIPLTQKK